MNMRKRRKKEGREIDESRSRPSIFSLHNRTASAGWEWGIRESGFRVWKG